MKRFFISLCCALGISISAFGDSSFVATPNAFSTATGTTVSILTYAGASTNITSVSLTAGNWMCSGNIQFIPAGGTVTSFSGAFTSTTSTAAVPSGSTVNGGGYTNESFSLGAAGSVQIGAMPWRYVLAATTTVYLEAAAVFTVSTLTGTGTINCWQTP